MLTKTHREMLIEGSAISCEVIEARGYDSVTAESPDLEPFARSQRQTGLLIPGWDIYGQRHPGQLRPDMPRVITRGDKDVLLKYESPKGSRSYLDVHPSIRERIRDTNEAFLITEGVKKADCAISHGALCVSLLGVWGWKGRVAGTEATAVIQDFDAIPMKGRRVILAFDSDVIVKREVQQALRRLVAVLERYGADVYMVTWGEEANAA